MMEARNWHLWRMENGRKIPYQVDGVSKAKSNDPATWASYEEAVEAMESLEGFQLAFTLGTDDDNFTGIDADDAFAEDGSLHPWAKELYELIKDFSYVEYSPSGTGFKAVLINSKASYMRSVYKQSPGQIEIYDNARFWAYTGQAISDSLRPSTGIEVMKAYHWIHGNFEAPKASKPRIPIEPSRDDWFRENEYMSKVESPAQGGRNEWTFKVAGHIASFGRSEEETLRFLRPYYDTMPQGGRDHFSLEEFESAIRSSFRNGTAREDKGASTYSPSSEIVVLDGLDVFSSDFTEETPMPVRDIIKPTDKSMQIPEDIWRDGGFIEKWTDWCMSTMRREQPELALSAALHVMSLALSRRYSDDSEHMTMPNMYTIAVGRSGCGKEMPRKKIAEFLDMSESGSLNGPGVFDSSAGLASHVVKNPSCGYMLDEVGDMMAQLAERGCPHHFRKLSLTLKTLYSGSGSKGVQPRCLAGDDGGKNDSVDYPHVHIYGTTTPEKLLRSVTDDQIEDGLMGRFMLFFASDSPKKSKAKKSGTPHGLIEHFRRYRGDFGSTAITDDLLNDVGGEAATNIMEITRTDEAADRLDDHYDAIYDRNEEKGSSDGESVSLNVWNRASEKTAKLALLFAASREPDPAKCKITLEDANRAIRLSNFLTRRVVVAYNERVASEYEKDRDFVYSNVPAGWITEAQLNHRCRRITPRLRDQIISDLLKSETITKGLKGGRIVYSSTTEAHHSANVE